MSAYSDWKCGALSDQEYTDYCNWEARMDKYLEDEMYNDSDCEDDFDDF
jgi:hypothetical protein